MSRLFVQTGIAFAITVGFASTAHAQSVDGTALPPQKCNTINCGSQTIQAGVNGAAVASNPWVGVFRVAATGFCLRFEITDASEDLAMTVVAPNGSVFTDDDSGTCTHCPRVVIASKDSGAYTVILNHFSGTPIETGFQLKAGRYVKARNVNCASPTQAASRTPAEARAKRAAGK
jgi:hypothetical protein